MKTRGNRTTEPHGPPATDMSVASGAYQVDVEPETEPTAAGKPRAGILRQRLKGSMQLRRFSFGLWTAVCLLLASPVSAQAAPEGRPAPYAAGEITLEFQLDHDTGRGSSGSQRTTAEASADAEVGLWLSPVVSVQSDITLDSTDNRLSDENLVFGEAGLRAQELYLQLDVDMLRVFAGKFEVDFGVAWDDAYGIYGSDLAEEYELTERIGVGAEVHLADTAFGTHKLSGSVFFADTTFLSGNLINGNDRLRRSDGGPGNTEYPSSFSLAAHGTGFILPTDVNYHAAFSYLPAGRRRSARSIRSVLRACGCLALDRGSVGRVVVRSRSPVPR